MFMDPTLLIVLGAILIVLILLLLSAVRIVQQYERGVIFILGKNRGVKVTAVEIKDIELPNTMQRAMAKQAEAEREKRAKIIHAQGELQASAQLAEAANVIGSHPNALQLRYLQTLTEIAVEKNSTIIFPLPIDLVEPLLGIMRHRNGEVAREQFNGP